MESQFTQEADPFGNDGGMGEFENGGEPPIVNREGEPVDEQIPGQTTVEEQLAAADGNATQVGAEPEEEASKESDPSPASTEAGTDAAAVATSGEDPPTAPESSQPSDASADDGLSSEEGESTGQNPGEARSDLSPEPVGEAADAPAPATKKGDTRRQYLIFVAEGAGTFAEVVWHEDKKGKMVPKGTHGAKRQTVCLARGQDEALEVGYKAMGSPEGEVRLVAVAASYFQVRSVSPDPVQPVRVRLKIK